MKTVTRLSFYLNWVKDCKPFLKDNSPGTWKYFNFQRKHEEPSFLTSGDYSVFTREEFLQPVEGSCGATVWAWLVYKVGKIMKPVKVWLVLLWLVRRPLNLVGTTEIWSPGFSSRTAEPDVTRKASELSHSVMWLSSPFISFTHTCVVRMNTSLGLDV